jgi:hypothetical protein
METIAVAAHDRELIQAAADVIRRNYDADRHQVGAAVRCASGSSLLPAAYRNFEE